MKHACSEEMARAFEAEQKGLCAFCCNKLDAMPEPDRGRIAHVSPRDFGEIPETEWSNLVLSCDSELLSDPSCDAKQGNKPLPVSPLMPGIEGLFHYYLSGRMEGLNENARETIRILNLDSADEADRNHRLRTARRIAIQTAAEIKDKLTAAEWDKTLRGAYRPLPAFQPALAKLLR
ncbi:hypothetical protein EON81_19490 [bacterium]|nr:MAG: hypothetical protein EON81_19490 [bacterium]